MLIVTPIAGFCNCSLFCSVLLYVHSSFAIILMGKREIVALLCLSSVCLVIVVWFFLTMPRVCLHFVIVVFPDHTHLLFRFSYVRSIFRHFLDKFNSKNGSEISIGPSSELIVSVTNIKCR